MVRVGFEVENIKSLDDVAVYYGDGMADEDGYPLKADYHQVKFHVTAAGAFTGTSMTDPAFINASSVSLLQRLWKAQQQYAPDGRGCRFILRSPWFVHPDNPLAEILSQKDGHLDWPKLSRMGPKSRLGRLRALWREHLGLASDDELEVVLRPLRIQTGPTLDDLGERLNVSLQAVGFAPITDGVLANPYDDLSRKLLQQGRTQFTRHDLEVIARREGLWRGHTIPEPEVHRIGIRSFLRWSEHLEDETDELLDLNQHFEGRPIRSPDLWASAIYPEVQGFLSRSLHGRRRVHLHLHAHTTIAYATGHALAKAATEVIPVQSTSMGSVLWRPVPDPSATPYPGWQFADDPLGSTGHDVALGVSVRYDVRQDVRAYVARALPQVGRIIWCSVPPGPSDTVVTDGAHARQLAQELCAHLKEHRTADERRGVLHIFASAPVVLLFLIGRLGLGLGRCTLYEYELEGNDLGAYTPSLSFPPQQNGGSIAALTIPCIPEV